MARKRKLASGKGVGFRGSAAPGRHGIVVAGYKGNPIVPFGGKTPLPRGGTAHMRGSDFGHPGRIKRKR